MSVTGQVYYYVETQEDPVGNLRIYDAARAAQAVNNSLGEHLYIDTDQGGNIEHQYGHTYRFGITVTGANTHEIARSIDTACRAANAAGYNVAPAATDFAKFV